ncbi:MAG TPA: glycoside hydrolase family 3 C-terminal domain-containing protein, partial [Mycobacterium sp.]|nr:glycoside hydrolase family 3 C-terminal domain-containing protein [Mycobacterium sp.]
MTTPFAAAVQSVRSGRQDIEQASTTLVTQLTDHELLWLLDGDVPALRGGLTAAWRLNSAPFQAGRIDRLGIPGIRFTDGPRGVVLNSSTAFPVAIARAASWDPDLERTIGDAIGKEARAQGANLFAGVCVNLAYSPGWGRAQESYGEDPILLGAMGAALVDGVNPWVMSCVKHYALNSMEDARFILDVHVDEAVLREVFLPHFRTVIEAGCDAVMTAYNSVNGEWAGENRHLLTEILRQDWGFKGFVMTDFVWGLRHPVESVAAGQDLEMPFRQQRAATLSAALRCGRLACAEAQAAAGRILASQLRLALRARPAPPPDVVACAAHRDLARHVARCGTVLLRNEPVAGAAVLPLRADTVKNLAVLGPLADQPNLGDHGSSRVHPPTTVSILQGLRERLALNVIHGTTADSHAAAEIARMADAAVLVVGMAPADEGESIYATDTASLQLLGGIFARRPLAVLLGKVLKGLSRLGKGGDRRDLRLHARDTKLVNAVTAANARTIVVVIAGGTVVVDPWDADVPALLLAWYPGMEGGRAIAEVLLGEAEPGGRLPVTIPRRAVDLPVVD